MGMEKYMGYAAKEPPVRPERELPEINIAGTLFLIDLVKSEFRQKDDPFNRMTLGDAKEEMGFSHFLFDTETKNKYIGNVGKASDVPEHVKIILVSPLKDMDPVGLARRHGLPDDFYGNKKAEKVVLTAIAQKPAQEDQPKKNRGLRH
jgi:hypothetical protein